MRRHLSVTAQQGQGDSRTSYADLEDSVSPRPSPASPLAFSSSTSAASAAAGTRIMTHRPLSDPREQPALQRHSHRRPAGLHPAHLDEAKAAISLSLTFLFPLPDGVIDMAEPEDGLLEYEEEMTAYLRGADALWCPPASWSRQRTAEHRACLWTGCYRCSTTKEAVADPLHLHFPNGHTWRGGM